VPGPGSTNGLEPGSGAKSDKPNIDGAHVDEWAFIDLHCHTAASFDSLARTATVVQAAVRRGLTHLAITDHDTIDGALEAQGLAPDGLTVIVGQEIRTTEGDLIGTFLHERVPRRLSPEEAIAAVREQGGLVGMPHPFDRLRGSLGIAARDRLIELAGQVDWIEAWNARLVVGDGNRRAAELAAGAGIPGVAVSDAHTTLEVAVASTALSLVAGDPATPDGLLAALNANPRLMTGRASLYVRAVTPVAKLIKRVRGGGRGRGRGPGRRSVPA
jgi:predicted metal-dependent phosphoesterase TrpH